MKTSTVLEMLRREGYDVTGGYLDFLFREHHIERPPMERRRMIWAPADVNRLKSVLKRRDRGPVAYTTS